MASIVEAGRSWLRRWRGNDEPSPDQVAFMGTWLSGLADDPRQSPSRMTAWPFPHQGGDELWTGFLIGGDAFVVYTIDEGAHVVRVLYVGYRPPDHIDFRPAD